MKYPQQIYVRVENDGTVDEFLLANEKPQEFAETNREVEAAVYVLKEVVEVTATVNVKVAPKEPQF